MTTPEHTLVGIHFAFATGLHRFVGWRGVAMAGVASNVPDWDGIPMLFDMQRFESGHRVWGHGIMSIFLASLLLGFFQIRWDWIGFIANRFPIAMPKNAVAAAPRNSEWLIGGIGSLVFASIAMCATNKANNGAIHFKKAVIDCKILSLNASPTIGTELYDEFRNKKSPCPDASA